MQKSKLIERNGIKAVVIDTKIALNKVGFGCICDQCGKDFYDEGLGYYIPVLNQYMCKDCGEMFMITHSLPDADKKYQDRQYNWIKRYIDVEE